MRSLFEIDNTLRNMEFNTKISQNVYEKSIEKLQQIRYQINKDYDDIYINDFSEKKSFKKDYNKFIKKIVLKININPGKSKKIEIIKISLDFSLVLTLVFFISMVAPLIVAFLTNVVLFQAFKYKLNNELKHEVESMTKTLTATIYEYQQAKNNCENLLNNLNALRDEFKDIIELKNSSIYAYEVNEIYEEFLEKIKYTEEPVKTYSKKL